MLPIRLPRTHAVSNSASIARAAFSTSGRRCSGKAIPSATSSFADLAESFSKQPPRPSTRPSSGPVSIPARRGGLKNPSSSATGGHSRLTKLINETTALRDERVRARRGMEGASSTTLNNLERDAQSKALSTQIKRKWAAGDTYAPHDMSWQEQRKWQKNERPKYDVFDITNFNPLEHYKNFAVLSEFVSPLGRIYPRGATGLRPVNQRRIAKAVRRAVGLGLMPSVYKHPEFLQRSTRRAIEREASWIKG